MVWVVQLEEVVDGTVVSRTEVATLDRPRCLESLEDLGLRETVQNLGVDRQSPVLS